MKKHKSILISSRRQLVCLFCRNAVNSKCNRESDSYYVLLMFTKIMHVLFHLKSKNHYNPQQILKDFLWSQFFCFFLSWFPFTNIHESQDCRGRGRAFRYLLTTTSTRFTDTQTLTGRLLQRAHLCTQPAAGLEAGTSGFRAQVVNH